jgi:predicted DNA-binding transcriptional regulator AlpA
MHRGCKAPRQLSHGAGGSSGRRARILIPIAARQILIGRGFRRADHGPTSSTSLAEDNVANTYHPEPNQRLIKIRELLELTARSRASLYRDMAAGRLPQPIKIGSSSRWRYGDVIASIAAMEAACSSA